MTILHRYVFKEVATTWLAITLLLMLVTIGLFLADTLADVARGTVPANLLFSVIGLRSLDALTVMFPLSLFLAILLALSRMYRDSEMAVLSSFGFGRIRLYRPLAWMMLPMSVVLLGLALYVSPWAVRTSKTLINDATRHVSVAGLQAGRFHQIAANEGVVYVETVSQDGLSFENAFIHTERNGRKDVVTAKRGYQYRDEASGARFLALFEGFRSEGVPGQADYRWMHFARNDVRLPDLKDGSGPALKPNAQDFAALADLSPESRWAELHWRLAPAMAAIVLGLLAVPLSKTTPRQGYYGNLVVAILTYVVYANLLAIGRSMIEDGEIPPTLGLWWVHAGVVIVSLLLLRNPMRAARAGKVPA